MLSALEKACGGDWMVCRVMPGSLHSFPWATAPGPQYSQRIKEFDGTGDVLERERDGEWFEISLSSICFVQISGFVFLVDLHELFSCYPVCFAKQLSNNAVVDGCHCFCQDDFRFLCQ